MPQSAAFWVRQNNVEMLRNNFKMLNDSGC